MSTATPTQTAPSMSPADRAAHEAGSYVRSSRTAVRTRICQEAIVELSGKDARSMTLADFDRLAQAQAELNELTARTLR